MSKILVYTFRTFPYKSDLKILSQNVFVLGKLKVDLNSLYDLILRENPIKVLGIAVSNDKHSYFEPIAINKFNKSKRVEKFGSEKLNLYVPNLHDTGFLISKSPSTSFCNYTMYKIQNFILENDLNTNFAFTHISKKDIPKLKDLV